MNTFKILSGLLLSVVLAGCATLVNGQTQEVTVLTPGAREARCTLDNGTKYSVYTDQKIVIMRNQKDIIVDCYAAGNRHRTMSIESDGSAWALGNVVNGIIPGVTYDHFSKGLYDYPETITVDFVGVPATGFELPEYHNKDAPNPYEQPIESYGASKTRLPSDEGFAPVTLQKREQVKTPNPFGSYGVGTGVSSNSGSGSSDIVTPMPQSQSITPPSVPSGASTEELNRSMNPSVFRN